MVLCGPVVPFWKGIGTFAMPRHAPHELSINAVAASATPRIPAFGSRFLSRSSVISPRSLLDSHRPEAALPLAPERPSDPEPHPERAVAAGVPPGTTAAV